jgi:hypothetical protein
MNSRHYEAVDVKCEKANHELPAYHKEPGEKIPVTGFNPVTCFLAELRVSTVGLQEVSHIIFVMGYQK